MIQCMITPASPATHADYVAGSPIISLPVQNLFFFGSPPFQAEVQVPVTP